LNCWRNIASTNKRRSYHELVAAGGALFAIGGFDKGSTSSVERLDDLIGQWQIVQSMKTPRYCFTAVVYDDCIYAIGGCYISPEKSVEKYDLDNDMWTVVSSMSVERCFHAACVIHETVFVLGGQNAANEVVKEIDCYNPKLDHWTIIGETEQECLNHAVVAV